MALFNELRFHHLIKTQKAILNEQSDDLVVLDVTGLIGLILIPSERCDGHHLIKVLLQKSNNCLLPQALLLICLNPNKLILDLVNHRLEALVVQPVVQGEGGCQSDHRAAILPGFCAFEDLCNESLVEETHFMPS